MMTLKISVVIPTYRRCEQVRRAIEALRNQTLDPAEFEAVVAIDGSDDGTREMLAAMRTPFPLHSVWQTNQGRASACNAGLAHSKGEVVVILDDDMEASPHLLAEHWQAHQGHPRLGVIGAVPIAVTPHTPPVARYIGDRFNQHLARLARPGHVVSLRDFYSGNFSIRRTVLEAVGGYDRAFTIYGNEDVELGIRLRQAGVTLVFRPAALAHQHYTKDFGGLARDTQAKGRTAVLLAVKHPETVPEGRLGSYRHGTRKVRLLRTALLVASRVDGALPRHVIGWVQRLERMAPARLTPVYHATLDFFFWLGVRQALQEHWNDPAYRAAARSIDRAHV